MSGTIGKQELWRHCALHVDGPRAMVLATLAWLAVGLVWLIAGPETLGRRFAAGQRRRHLTTGDDGGGAGMMNDFLLTTRSLGE